MKRLFALMFVLLLVGCSTLTVDGVSYNSLLSTTDTLSITRPDGTKITLKGKTTLDPGTLNAILSGAGK